MDKSYWKMKIDLEQMKKSSKKFNNFGEYLYYAYAPTFRCSAMLYLYISQLMTRHAS